MKNTNYEYNGFMPYGAGEVFILDMYEKTTEEHIKDGAEFEIYGNNAVLVIDEQTQIQFVKMK